MIRPVHQVQENDCGAACLAMVLEHHGRRVPLDVVHDALATGRDGADAATLLDAARGFGLRARGVSLELDELDALPEGSILHWGFVHFVVFERRTAQGVAIVDPAVGRRTVSLARFGRAFTGVALVFDGVTSDFDAQRPGPSPYWSHVRRTLGASPTLARAVVASVAIRGFALVGPALSATVIDRVLPTGDRGLLVAVLGAAAWAAAFLGVATALRARLLLALKTRLDLDTGTAFLSHLMGLPFPFFQRRSTGDLLTRTQSHQAVREQSTAAALTALIDGPFAAVWGAALVAYSPSAAAVTLGFGAAHLGLGLLGRRRYRELAAAELEARSHAQGELVRMIAGSETLKAQGLEHTALDRWTNRFVDELNATIRRGSAAATFDAARAALKTLGPLVVLAAGAAQVIGGGLTVGELVGCLALAAGFLEPLDALVEQALRLASLGGHVERIDDVLRAAPERRPDRPGRRITLHGAVRLERVTFRHGRGPNTIDPVDLEVPAGSCLAIVGPSGSGKSTLAKLILGLYVPSDGAVWFDGAPLDSLDLQHLRRQVGIVMQKPHLFGGSILRNLAFGHPEATLEQLREAARLAALEDRIARMPMGWDTSVGDDGDALSGGERQRLALARALLGRPKILVLDEATSALDAETESKVLDNLATLPCTRIVIAHRRSTVRCADQIVVVDQGRIVERGSHDELMRRRGRYLALVGAAGG